MATIFTRTLAAFEAEMGLYFAHLGKKSNIRRAGDGWLANAPFWDFNAKLSQYQEKIGLLAGLFESGISPDEQTRLNEVLELRKGQIRDDAWLLQLVQRLRK